MRSRTLRIQQHFSNHHAKNFRMVFDVGTFVLAADPSFADPRIIIYVLKASYIRAKSRPASNKINVMTAAFEENKPMVLHFLRHNP
jgi:hypothetical protein